MTAWQLNRQALQRHLETEPLDNLLAWSTVRKTMYVGPGAAQIMPEYEALERDLYKWMPVITLRNFGDNMGADVIKSAGHKSDPNLVHQAYHLKQWLDRTKQDITGMRSIIEFGAGYGAMALICFRLGFQGLYYIIDLPECVQLQKHYLYKTIPEQWSRILWLTSQPLSNMSCDLFIASHSLSEIPIEEREKWLLQVATKEYLFASSYEFEGTDNQAWFQGLGAMPGYDWVFYPHRWQENAFYMVGVRL